MKRSPLILLVNRGPRNAALLSQFLERQGYRAASARTLDELDDLLDDGSNFDLAIIDVSGFDRQIWDRCSRLRSVGVPFLLISSPSTRMGASDGLRHGATGLLTKPVAMKDLAHLINSLME